MTSERRTRSRRLAIFSTKVHVTRVATVKGNFIAEDRRENRSRFSATGPYANYCFIKHLVASFRVRLTFATPASCLKFKHDL